MAGVALSHGRSNTWGAVRARGCGGSIAGVGSGRRVLTGGWLVGIIAILGRVEGSCYAILEES
jgi:hypothetical protein